MTSENQLRRPPFIRLMLLLLPLATMMGAFVWIAALDPLRSFNNGAPPVEALTVERTIIDANGIALKLRAGGSAPMVIAQVAVDDAYWSFTQDPAGPIARGNAVWVQIPYPWVLGEAHNITLLRMKLRLRWQRLNLRGRSFACRRSSGRLLACCPWRLA